MALPLRRVRCASFLDDPGREGKDVGTREMGARASFQIQAVNARVPEQGRGGCAPRPSHQFLETGLGWRPQLS